MIQLAGKPFDDQESLSALNPYVREWFTSSFSELTPPQKYAFKLISEGKNVLITAPTGSGKTMSGFLSIISRLFDYSLQGKLEDRVYCIYVSPLRALNNDIFRNLTKPLNEIYEIIKKEKGIEIIKNNIKQVTIGVRTGDTSQKERRAQLLKPPNILVTTPESLAIILNSEKFIESFKGIEFIIMDEVHELANNKRGVHLALSMARLKDMIPNKPATIGLSATLYPLDEAARYIVGYKGGEPNDCVMVDASWSKKLEVKAISPVEDMIYSDEDDIERLTYDEMDRIIKSGKTTLIFTNTRSGTERVVFNLKKRFGYADADVAAHHSSLSRESRLDVEEQLKKGSLKAVVSSTSLELGVDIGNIDNVVQLGSPKSVTRAIQRIGRAGHSYKATARGEMLVLNRDDLVECSIMLDAALKRHLDSFKVPQNALDVLAQHIIGMSINKIWDVDEALGVIKTAYPYHYLGKEDYMSVINYLAGSYVGLESRRVYGKIWYDDKERKFGKRGKLMKVIYMLNLGTIPDEVAVSVYSKPHNKHIGSIEEEFLAKLTPGDVFTLGGKLYKFESAKGMKCYVSDAKGLSPTIPPWFSEQLPLSFELANEIGQFRKDFSTIIKNYLKKSRAKYTPKMALPEPIDAYLSNLPVDGNSKRAMFGYFAEQLLYAGEVPSSELLLIESTQDPDEGKNYLVFHSLYGRRINDALSRAFGIELSEMFDTDIGVMVNDNGFVLTIEDEASVTDRTIKNAISDIRNVGLKGMLKSNIRRTELLRRKFRHVAARSFMILRNYKGWKITVGRQQVNSQLIFKAAEEIDPDFPIIKETYREILDDLMDTPRAQMLLDSMHSGKLKYKVIHTDIPSPFSHTIITLGHADVILMKERRRYLQQLHKLVLKRISEGG